jgi:molybdopterin-guanine dinucleotide biosynthesis protein A
MTVTTAAIIAGGRGTRLSGQVKGLLFVDGQRIIDRQRAVLGSLFDRVLLIANDPAPWDGVNLPIIPDRFVEAGPLAGIEAALGAVGDGAAGVVCVAGDLPFLDAEILRLLRDHAPAADAVVPRIAGRPEPLLARYAARVRPLVAAQLAAGDRAAHRLLEKLAVTWLEEADLRAVAVDGQLRFLTNINTPADLDQARSFRPR